MLGDVIMNKTALLLSIIGALICNCVTYNYQVEATEIGIKFEQDRTEGLISNRFLSISKSGNNILITAYTYSNAIMSWIGIQNISIERSSDNVHWTEESNLGSMYTFNSSSYTITNYNVIVNGGYYYRVSLKHYADNGYGTTQTVDNTSNTVWIPHP